MKIGRILRLAVVTCVLSVPLQMASAAQSTSRLVGTVGAGKTLTLTGPSGSRVTRVPHGEFIIVIRDRSARRNFHLTGTGGFSKKTGIRFTGAVTWRLKLAAGPYRYVSDTAPSLGYSFIVR
jgi:hypothetical protein